MITPHKIDTSRNFVGSSFGKAEKEIVARNIVVVSQIIAEAKHDNSWHPFSMEEYVGVRYATSEEPVSFNEQHVLGELATSGHLSLSNDGSFAVTDEFLSVISAFVIPVSTDTLPTHPR